MVLAMRQHCELCAALGADSARGHKLIGMAVGPRDALLCAEHALFSLDTEVESLEELRELFEFVSAVEPPPDAVAAASVSRGGQRRDSASARGSGSAL
jgi:hypothetical protein